MAATSYMYMYLFFSLPYIHPAPQPRVRPGSVVYWSSKSLHASLASMEALLGATGGCGRVVFLLGGG